MIRRILMALLVLGLAFPALAAPLGHQAQPAPAPIAATQHHDHLRHVPAPTPQGHGGQHECIGCIVNLALPELPAASLPPFATQGLALVPARASSVGKPDTPPPKA